MTSPIKFLQETKQELVQVVWPTRAEVIRLTGIVLVASVIVGLYIGGLDYLFTKAVELLIGK